MGAQPNAMCCARLTFKTKRCWFYWHYLVFLIPIAIMCVPFKAASSKPLTFTFFYHHDNSSTVPLITPTLSDLPPPHIPSLENFNSEEQVSVLFWSNIIYKGQYIVHSNFLSVWLMLCSDKSQTLYTNISRGFMQLTNIIYTPRVPQL